MCIRCLGVCLSWTPRGLSPISPCLPGLWILLTARYLAPVLYKREYIDSQFLSDPETIAELNTVMDKLSDEHISQNEVNGVYEQFCEVINSVIDKKLPKQTIRLSTGVNNKRRRRGKPWWTDELSAMCTSLCDSEKQWTKSTHHDKPRLKGV